jgi:hypothetical protein
VKKKIFKHSILLILYTLVNLYFAIFNWQVFTVKLNIDLGFGVITLPPFVVTFLFGFIIIGILSWMNYMSDLQKTIYELEQGVEIGRMRDKLVKTRIKELLLDDRNLELLMDKIGIQDIRKKQDELMKSILEINQKVQNRRDN